MKLTTGGSRHQVDVPYDVAHIKFITSLFIYYLTLLGGTDIIACFMGENSVLPVHRGQIQSAHLGCTMECWSEDGKPAKKGETGDLVCTR